MVDPGSADFSFDDEFDEIGQGHNTRTYVYDVSDLDAPTLNGFWDAAGSSIDHNQYVRGNLTYQANYTRGLRILELTDLSTASFTEVGFFDTYPASDGNSYNGAWSTYPFFASGIVLASDINRGLFILQPSGGCTTNADCHDGIACTTDSCNLTTSTCEHTPFDLLCDNGLFCDGVETCDVAQGCQPGSDPCGGGACDEAGDVCTAVCGDGTCDPGEDCNGCPSDCPSFSLPSSVCGNGLCEAGDGEDCVTCPQDCNGVQGGKPSGRFCCGFGGSNPVGCSDSRCTSGGFSCTEDPVGPGGSTCCGDSVCEDPENGTHCSLDCGAPAVCGDGTCDPGEDTCSCAADCGAPPASEGGFCSDGVDNDCDGPIDCDDSDCSGDAACSCGQRGDTCSSGADCCSGNGRCK